MLGILWFGVIAVAVVPASASATAALRRRVDGGEEHPHQHPMQISSTWPFHDDSNIQDGITFQRTETSCPLLPSWWQLSSRLSYLFGSSMYLLPTRFLRIKTSPKTSPHATFDSGHCNTADQFGGNDCHYSWGDAIKIQYDGSVHQDLGTDMYIEMSLKVDNLIHHTQTCPICGDDPCTISIEGIPKSWSIALPKCPITPDVVSGEIEAKLPDKNPIPSLLSGSSGTVIEGSVWLKKRNGQDGGQVLMLVRGNAHLK